MKPFPTSVPSRDDLRRRFVAACESSGGPPDVEPFLIAFDEPERSAVRNDLEAIRARYTGSFAANPTADGTGEYASPLPAGGSDATVDEVPRPDATVDHVRSPDGTVDHVASLDGTVDRVASPDDHVGHSPAAAKPGIPSSIAGYEILGTLGRGAMGVVYKARQRGLKRLVALKMILSGDHTTDHDLKRFRSEAEAVAKLQHPNIVQIYEVGEDAGRPFFSLEFVEGSSLDKKVRGTPLPPIDAARLLCGMAEAMEYAHRAGVIHRDLKPANILLTLDGLPKIGDFGLAKRLEDDESGVTRTGTVLGTPSYMPPEQAEGKIQEVGPLADVYSLGAILYEMLTGRPPFRSTSILATLQLLRTQEPVPPRQFQPGVPKDLETICLKCLAKERGKRYASAGELAADVTRFLEGKPILARPVGVFERTWRWARRNPAGAAGVLVLLGWAVSMTVFTWQYALKTDEANRNAAVAREKTGIAEEKTKVAVERTKAAIDAGERQRETADVAVSNMVEVVGKLDSRLQSKRLSIQGGPEVRRLRAEVLADLRKALDNVSKKIQASATTTFADVVSAQQLGGLLEKLGQAKEAREAYRSGYDSVKRRVALEPNNDRARGNLGAMETRLGNVAMELEGDARTALAHYREALRLHVEIRTAPRSGEFGKIEIERVISHDDASLAEALLALGRPAEARKYLLESVTFREGWLAATPKNKNGEPRSYVMQAQMLLAVAASDQGDAKGEQDHFARAAAIGEGLIKDFPAYLPFKEDLADVLGNHGDALVRFGKWPEAEKTYQAAMANLKLVLARNPDDLGTQRRLAETFERLGRVYVLLGKPTEATKPYQEALRLRRELLEIDPNNLSRQMAYLVSLARSGKHAEALGFIAQVRPRMVQSTPLMLQVARVYALCAAGDSATRKKSVEQAMAALAVATKDDYAAAAALATDPDLVALRDEPAFKALLATIKKR